MLFCLLQAFDLVNEESSHAFLSKGAMVLAGIYLFFITERLLKSIMRWRKVRAEMITRRPLSTAIFPHYTFSMSISPNEIELCQYENQDRVNEFQIRFREKISPIWNWILPKRKWLLPN